MSRAYLSLSLADFVDRSIESIHSSLEREHSKEFGQTRAEATEAWWQSLSKLQTQIREFIRKRAFGHGHVLLEYRIPRLRSRIDAVLILGSVIYVLEFKSSVGAESAAKAQALKYRQELKDFHEGSRNAPVVPIAVGDGFRSVIWEDDWISRDAVSCVVAGADEFAATLLRLHSTTATLTGQDINPHLWDESRYYPVPPIVEAITELFERQDISEIAHSHAGEAEMDEAKSAILQLVEGARRDSEKVLCVLTGVPGAGKTLVGLSVVSSLPFKDESHHPAAFLSGNGPLVKVLQESLVRWMNSKQMAKRGTGVRKLARAFIQEMHLYLSEAQASSQAQIENVLVFDEAQRAWSEVHNQKKALANVRRGHRESVNVVGSEAEIVMRVMDRQEHWAVVVALVGGGQEIHHGEAGLEAWGEAVGKLPTWRVVASPEALYGGPSVAGRSLFPQDAIPGLDITEDPRLHLNVSKRSIESDVHAQWVNALLDGDLRTARELAGSSARKVVITRRLEHAREWLRDKARGHYRAGLVASSGALRLRAYGVEPPTFQFLSGIDYPRWFLDPREDVRSSDQLEVAMSEFEMQGLEIDYVGLCWGGDLLWSGAGWKVQRFAGNAWKPIHGSASEKEASLQRLTLNKYRVLLTRFRKGMIVFVPPGTDHPTDRAEHFDRVVEALLQAGAELLNV